MGRKETCISDISQEVPIELIPRASIVGPTGVSKCVSYTDTILRFTRTHFVRWAAIFLACLWERVSCKCWSLQFHFRSFWSLLRSWNLLLKCLIDWFIYLFHLLSDLYRYRSSHSEYTKVHRVCKAFVTSQFAKQPKHRLIKHKSIKCMSKSSIPL